MRETTYHVTVRGASIPVTVRESEAGLEVSVDGTSHAVDLRRVSGTPLWSLLLANASHKAVMVRDGERWSLDLNGASEFLEIGTERDRILKKFAPQKQKKSGLLVIASPMPGLVLSVKVKEGDRVEPGQSVATVEAMKMENEFKAADAGVVQKVHVVPGATVAKGAPVVTLRLGEPA